HLGALGPLPPLPRARGPTRPDAVGGVSVCPDVLAEQHAPRLTAVTGPRKELGQLAVEQVMARITALAEGGAPEDELVLMPPELVVRESTAPAPRRLTHR
ncbi:substrate-binding domain-containing protein, partial [Streptomyces sp. NPDC055815]